MKNSAPEDFHTAASQIRRIRKGVVVCAFFTLLAFQVFGQAPTLLWTTNLGAKVFAVDTQTNVYAQAGNAFIKLNNTGVPLQTNIMGADVGVAQRDAAGNIYYAAIRGGNFVGIGHNYTNSPGYLLKLDPVGSLIWSNHFGPVATLTGIGVQSLLITPDDNCYVALVYGLSSTFGACEAYKFNAVGSNVWKISLPRTGERTSSVFLAPASATNFYCSTYSGGMSTMVPVAFGAVDANGATTTIAYWGNLFSSIFSGPIGNSFGEIFNVEGAYLTKRTAVGGIIWSNPVSGLRTVGADKFDGLHGTDDAGLLYRYDYDGGLAWQMNLGSRCNGMVLDATGNRFLSTVDGRVLRLGDEPLLTPTITNGLIGKMTFAGSNHIFSVGAQGSGPLRHFWLLNGAPLPGKTNATLNLSGLTAPQSGSYSVIISNFMGSVTSTPAGLTVKNVGIFIGNQMLTNGTYNFLTPPALSILTAYTNGSRFYTLDGSAPTFASSSYATPFLVATSTIVRALGYSADFSQSEEAEPANIVLPPSFSLIPTSTPGGNVTMNPIGGVYLSNSVVTLTATPTNGWSFLYWLGDVSGTSNSINVTVNGSKSIHAVFGSTLSTTVSGNGQVAVYPPGGVYPYGTTVRLTGVPQAGNYFGVWGNAASGTANPLYFTLTNPNPTVSSLFASLAANQSALTVLVNGPGSVQVNPAGNVFTTNQSVNITATPLAGQGFVNWSGDAAGTQNPVSVDMTQSRVVTANFTNWPVLVANQQSFTPQGFQLSVLSGPGLVYQIQASSNLGTWTNLGVVTNTSGNTLFIDSAGTNLPMRFYRGTSWP